MIEKKFDMIGFGNPFQDLIVELDKLPPTNVNIRMRNYVFQGGGNIPTATVAAGRLGLRAAILGVSGNDMFGHANKADFEYNHVDTSHLMLDEQLIGIILRHVNECVMVIQQGESFKCKIVLHPALRFKNRLS